MEYHSVAQTAVMDVVQFLFWTDTAGKNDPDIPADMTDELLQFTDVK